MSCGEPELFHTIYGTAKEMKHQLEFNEHLVWTNNTPLSEMPELSDFEYFQRQLIKGLGIPESYMLNNATPISEDHMCSQAYLDEAVAASKPPVVIDTPEQWEGYFGQTGDLSFDATMNEMFAYDGNEWGIIKDFNLFTVEMVTDPLLDDCRIQETDEDKYDRAMTGIGV